MAPSKPSSKSKSSKSKSAAKKSGKTTAKKTAGKTTAKEKEKKATSKASKKTKPAAKKTTSKPAAKKTKPAAKKTTQKAAPKATKKATAKKSTAKKETAKKAPAKKPAAKKTAAKKPAAKKDTPKKAAPKKSQEKKKAPAKTAEKKKAPAKKAAPKAKAKEADPSVTTLKEGKPAPKFKLPATTGMEIDSASFRGSQIIILYFYPKDNSPGCTIQAKDFEDQKAQFTRHGAIVMGISPDSMESHLEFAEKNNLSYPLLTDDDARIATKFDVWRKKTIFGREFMGIERTTFIIGKDGKIKKIFTKFKAKGHAKKVLKELKEII